MDKKLSEFYGGRILKELIWQDKVISFYDPVSGLPSGQEIKDRYISNASGNGGIGNYIYEGDGEIWYEIVPEGGTITLIASENKYYVFDGSGWILLDSIINHNEMSGIQGGATDEYYHLSLSEYNNLSGIDQSLSTTDDVTFDDITVSNPNNIYTSLNHDDFNDYVPEEHRQWENSITQNIHDDNITSSNVTQHETDIDHNNLTNSHQNVYTDSSPQFTNVTITGNLVNGNDSVTKDYVDSLIQGLNGQEGVIDFYDPTTATPSGSEGDRYISTATANGGTEDNIYEYENGGGTETVVSQGYAVWVETDDRKYVYQTGEWVVFGETITHNNTSGLQGGSSTERYHLQSSAYSNLMNQDQEVYSTSTPTFDDLSVTSPTTIYSDLNHDDFNDYVINEHIDHSTVEISGGFGLTGNGNITSSITLDLNANIDDLNDVDAASPTDRQGLIGNSSTSNWEANDLDSVLNAAYIDTYTGSSVIVPHNLNVPNVFVTTYDNNNNIRVNPTNVEILNDSEVLIEFGSSITFTAVIMEPGAPVETVLSLINFKGSGTDSLSGTGSLETPASTYHNNKFGVLLNDVAAVGDHEPGVSSEGVTIYDGIDDVLSSAAGTGLIYEPGTETMHLSASIDDLSNVTITSPTSGEALMYEDGTGVNKEIEGMEVHDNTWHSETYVTDAHFSGGTGISYSTGTITNTDTGSDAVTSHESTYDHTAYLTDITGESINDLSDVDTTGVSDAQVLTYNSTSSNGEAQDASTGTDTYVTSASLSGNDTLILNRSDGIDITADFSHTHSEYLTDSDIGTAAERDYTISTSDPSGGSDGDVGYKV